jgi:hypothetical protein
VGSHVRDHDAYVAFLQLSFQGIKDVIKDTLIHRMTAEVDNSDAFYKALLANNKSGLTIDQLSYNVLGLIVAVVTQFSQGKRFCPYSY